MKLQTNINLSKQSNNQIDYNSRVLLLGSCFAENIGHKFDYFKFQNSLNPFGILFHSLAIENLLARAINEEKYTKEELILFNEQWHCLDAHSSLSNSSRDVLQNNINSAINNLSIEIKDVSHVIITLGTSWVYRYLATDAVVANCHKIPQKQFSKELLSADEVLESLQAIISLLKSINTKVAIILTISPVRHLKDGFLENSQSKAHLITAAHQLIDYRKKIFYFPSYEIMMDELRDYRFYNEDMVHPNPLAVKYIWEKFREVWISEHAFEIMKSVDTIQKGLSHKPFNPNTERHRVFQKNLEEKILDLQQQLPNLQF